ncbi:hypothetical protein HAX54_014860, partial [Datura stramonium]|nr:hypothetical protein [Datura stramonium]
PDRVGSPHMASRHIGVASCTLSCMNIGSSCYNAGALHLSSRSSACTLRRWSR